MIKRIVDKYNTNKVWIIERTKCGHYYMSQEIDGVLFGKRVKTTKKHLIEIGLDVDFTSNDNQVEIVGCEKVECETVKSEIKSDSKKSTWTPKDLQGDAETEKAIADYYNRKMKSKGIVFTNTAYIESETLSQPHKLFSNKTVTKKAIALKTNEALKK